MEEWRDIPGYENLYQASKTGEIRTCEGKTTNNARYGKRVWKQRVLKQKFTKSRKGRIDARVSLWKDGCEHTHLVSRLVAMAWCDGYQDGFTVNHINGDTLDNNAENLEWVSLRENIKKGFADGLYVNNQIPVTLSGEGLNMAFDSLANADRFLGRSEGYISNRIKRNRPIISIHGIRYQVLIGG